MAISERFEFQSLTILSDGQIQVRRDRVVEDTVTKEELGRKSHRFVLEPGQDVKTLPKRLVDVCAAVWTPEVKAEFAAAKAKREAQFQPVVPGAPI